MAGIGFSIRRRLAKGTIRDVMAVYGLSALMGSGPWVISIAGLALLGLAAGGIAQDRDVEVFFVSVTYAFGFSLVSTGALQLLLSRCASDACYQKAAHRVGGIFLAGLISSMVVSLIVGLCLFLWAYPGNFLAKVSVIALFPVLGGIWSAVTFVSGQREFHVIAAIFMLGYALSIGLCWLIFQTVGGAYMMSGFVAGQVVLLALLVRSFHREFDIAQAIDFSYLAQVKRYRALVVGGFAYNAGIWIDKFIYWYASPFREHLGGVLFSCPIYDIPVYLSFLSIIPGMAIFLMKIETEFAFEMSEYLRLVEGKAPIGVLEDRVGRIRRSVVDGLLAVIKVQGFVTLLLVCLTKPLLQNLSIGALQAGIFQVTLIGAFLCVVFFCLLTLLFYLNRIREAAICALVLLVANALLTALNVRIGLHSYGSGFVAATGLSILCAYGYTQAALSELMYRTFATAPLGIYKSGDSS
jgi:uncharacterized membrane protein